MAEKNKKEINVEVLLQWFKENKRSLPWRKPFPHRNPYEVWVSEVMLQQTLVTTVINYYEHWLKIFPTIKVLAKASVNDVLLHWQGLGYYNRARNLHKTAQLLHENFLGKFPSCEQKLLQLPGIANYTASAIRSFAFCLPATVVDANVSRFVARFYGIRHLVSSAAFYIEVCNKISILQTNLKLQKDQFCSHKNEGEILKNYGVCSATLNEALIEFGALQCTAVNTACTFCIFKNSCISYTTGNVTMLPKKKKKVSAKKVFTSVLLLVSGKKVLLHKREKTSSGRMENLWEFVSLEHEKKLLSSAIIFFKWLAVMQVNANFFYEDEKINDRSIVSNQQHAAAQKIQKREKERLNKLLQYLNTNEVKALLQEPLSNADTFPTFKTAYTKYIVTVSGVRVALKGKPKQELNRLLAMPPYHSYKWVTKLQLERLPMAAQGSCIRRWYVALP